MKIYLVRHGESPMMGDDDKRPLSDQGKSDIERLAQFILPLNIKVSQILRSEKVRAQQTAEILAPSIHASMPIGVRSELDPLGSVDSMIDEINAHNKDIMLVGHMPYMGALTAKLVTGNADNNVILFDTSTMACLEQVSREMWMIRWVINPSLLYNRII